MAGFFAFLGLGIGAAAWWFTTKGLKERGYGVVPSLGLGLVAMVLISPWPLVGAQAVGLAEESQPPPETTKAPTTEVKKPQDTAPKPQPKPPAPAEPAPVTWETLKKPKLTRRLQGKTDEEIERLDRRLQVYAWNHKRDLGSRWGMDSSAEDLAKEDQIHMDVFKEAHSYMYAWRKTLAEHLKVVLEKDPEVSPDYYNPVIPTAQLGSYTVDANIEIRGCEGDSDIDKKVELATERLATAMPEFSGGFQVNDVRYKCERLGVDGSLGFGLRWKRGGEIEKRETCVTIAYETPENTKRWCMKAFNDGKVLDE